MRAIEGAIMKLHSVSIALSGINRLLPHLSSGFQKRIQQDSGNETSGTTDACKEEAA